MLKSLLHWKVLVNFVITIGIFVGLVWLTFRWLEFHTNHGQEVPVPEIVNLPVQKAIKVLDDSGLSYEVDSIKYDPKYRPYQVLQIYPSAGSRVKGGRSIILKVNPKSWAPVQVPDVLNKYKDLAFRQIEQIGLKVGDTIFENNVQRDAVIRLQIEGKSINPGALLPRFSSIDVVIGTGPKRNIGVPNLIGLSIKEAKQQIGVNLFEIGLIMDENDHPVKDDNYIVFFQDPDLGTLRDQGMQIDLWASNKSPAELQAKVDDLTSIYRVKLDTFVPNRTYEETPAPVYRKPSIPKIATEPTVTETLPVLPAEKPKQDEPKKEIKHKTPDNTKPQPIKEKPSTKVVIE